MPRFDELDGFDFTGVAVRRWNVIAFSAQERNWPDPLEPRPTRAFFYYADEPEGDRWDVGDIGEATGLSVCGAFLPQERWVFVADDGAVYVVGGGKSGFEKDITKVRPSYFSRVKCIADGNAVAVGSRRKVFVRRAPHKWEQLKTGLSPDGETVGFGDIDGFSMDDLYACGGESDLWHFNGARWSMVELPIAASLCGVCCAPDGIVYITTSEGHVIWGRDETWLATKKPITNKKPRSIVAFQGQVIVSTETQLFDVSGGVIQPASLGAVPAMRSMAHLAVGDGILVVAGRDEANSYDGVTWSCISPAS